MRRPSTRARRGSAAAARARRLVEAAGHVLDAVADDRQRARVEVREDELARLAVHRGAGGQHLDEHALGRDVQAARRAFVGHQPTSRPPYSTDTGQPKTDSTTIAVGSRRGARRWRRSRGAQPAAGSPARALRDSREQRDRARVAVELLRPVAGGARPRSAPARPRPGRTRRAAASSAASRGGRAGVSCSSELDGRAPEDELARAHVGAEPAMRAQAGGVGEGQRARSTRHGDGGAGRSAAC